MIDFYPLLRPLLFSLPPETAHRLSLASLRFAHLVGLLPRPTVSKSEPIALMGIRFANRLGLAAGFDKNAECVDALGALGFGFIEVGTVTPRAQDGNARPRLFRLTKEHALINRLGFPNEGVALVCERLCDRDRSYVCGINIGKNAQTPLDDAIQDYIAGLTAAYPYADYVAINISSPNTAELRQLQLSARLKPLLNELSNARDRLAHATGRRAPLVVKLTADLEHAELRDAARVAMDCGIDGISVTNTTLSRDGLPQNFLRLEGGLSGAPLLPRALSALRCLRGQVGAHYTLIGVGGIQTANDARAMRDAGADLVQIYTGFVYRGPALIGEILKALSSA